jgi:NAD+--dinitrogen-reductase ADP-D-ribosyltransferase
MVNDNTSTTLPDYARLPINHCNLPAVILGSLTFQRHPTALLLDGVHELHRDLFARLAACDDAHMRAEQFMNYMTVHFRLDALEEAGYAQGSRIDRGKADYLRLLRGWFFDADGREGAVWKGWVESRFGLLPRYHGMPIHSPNDESYRAYLEARSVGLYNTNALEAQLDLLYSYCQYELELRYSGQTHLRLYRGVNHMADHETLDEIDRHHKVVLLNNLSSFTSERVRADEFGDVIISAEVPLAKIAAFDQLLPVSLKGEREVMVIGGVYEVKLY